MSDFFRRVPKSQLCIPTHSQGLPGKSASTITSADRPAAGACDSALSSATVFTGDAATTPAINSGSGAGHFATHDRLFRRMPRVPRGLDSAWVSAGPAKTSPRIFRSAARTCLWISDRETNRPHPWVARTSRSMISPPDQPVRSAHIKAALKIQMWTPSPDRGQPMR